MLYRKWDKAFRGRQHPQTLDQWMNYPFIGQSRWKLQEFHIDPLLDILNLPCTVAQDPFVLPPSYPTHIPFMPSESTSHSWDTAISTFYLENPRSMLSVVSQFKVMPWVQHPFNSNPIFPWQSAPPPPLPLTVLFKLHLENHKSRS